MMLRINPYGHGIINRDDLIEMAVYTSTGTERVVPHLTAGDELRIQREGKTYNQMELQVVTSKGDHAIVCDGNTHYELWGRWHGPREVQAWLRKDGESRGRISSLTLLELV